MSSVDRGAVGDRYRSSRVRIEGLLGPIEDAQWDLPVAACPGWRVRDVLAHLVGITEDAAAGRIAGPPSPDQTADQVARHRHDDPRVLVRQWSDTAPAFEAGITAFEIWPAFIDVLSHEHDLRAALGDPGHRSHDDVLVAAGLLTERLPDGLQIRFDGATTTGSGPSSVRLTTTPFEAFRLRLGRRSRPQVLALDWTGDPAPILDGLFVFGPAATDIHE